MKLDFVRGHMGGNLILLLKGWQLPRDNELNTVLKVMDPIYVHAHETGILYYPEEGADIKARIVEPSSKCYITACGGFTQVLGAALIETELGKLFNINNNLKSSEVIVQTDCGPTSLILESNSGETRRVKTDMNSFVQECYDRGVRELVIDNLPVMQAGKFLILNADLFKKNYPFADFIHWDQKTREAVTAIQHQFVRITGEVEYNVTLYDWNPERGGDLRVLYPHGVEEDYFEPSCGTGTIALGIALLGSGELAAKRDSNSDLMVLKLESGGGYELGGPDLTELEMIIQNNKVSRALFSHSNVKITSVGEIWL